jgi:hypothetical protein
MLKESLTANASILLTLETFLQSLHLIYTRRKIMLFEIAIGMLGGLGLFLYGMQLMGNGLEKSCWKTTGTHYRNTDKQ